MTDPMNTPPADHGSDRYDYVELTGAPHDVAPAGEYFERIVAEPCQDCRANVFVTWLPEAGLREHHWSYEIAHDDTCPAYPKHAHD